MVVDMTGSDKPAVNDDIAIPPADAAPAQRGGIAANAPGQLGVIRRNGKVTHFDGDKIAVAMTKAFLAVEGGNAAASSRIHEKVAELTRQVVNALQRRNPTGGTVHIEEIQDQVELELMRGGEHKIARAYVLYREEQARSVPRKKRRVNRKNTWSISPAPTAVSCRWTWFACVPWSPRPVKACKDNKTLWRLVKIFGVELFSKHGTVVLFGWCKGRSH